MNPRYSQTGFAASANGDVQRRTSFDDDADHEVHGVNVSGMYDAAAPDGYDQGQDQSFGSFGGDSQGYVHLSVYVSVYCVSVCVLRPSCLCLMRIMRARGIFVLPSVHAIYGIVPAE
jgi:hypothetical protein